MTAGVSLIPSSGALAATGINKQISFQGKVVNSNGTNVANGSYSFVFSIYTVATAGSNIWTETKSLTVTDGVFQTNLGSTTSLPGSVDFNTDNIYLGINFNSDGEMTPRIQFTSAAYAFNAENANKLGGIAATGFAQLSPGSAQTGFLNVSGTINGATISGGTLSGSTLSASSLTFSAASGASIQAAANQNLTLSTVTSGTLALASAGAVNITGAGSSTFDVGAGNTISLQTTNNGPITTGSGLLTSGGNFTFSGTSARTITGPTTGGLTITDATGNLTLSTTTSGNIAANSAGTIALSGTNFGLSTAGAITLAGNQTSDITTSAGGTATPITIQPGSSSTNSATGANLVIKAGNETGTTSVGGSVTIDPGTGTGTAGSVSIGTVNPASQVSLKVTSGANSTTLNFVSPTSGGATTVTVPNNVGGTLCTNVASTCNTTYAPYSGTGYLFKGATDTSSAAAGAGYLYGFTNSSSALGGGVLSLTNGNNTGDTLYVTASGNPTSGNALIFASNTNASPSGNLLDLQAGSVPTSKFSVATTGDVIAAGGYTFLAGGNRQIKLQNQTAANTAGNQLQIIGANGKGSGNGGNLVMNAGDADLTGSGGNVSIAAGGSGSSGVAAGGILNLNGGASYNGTGAGGAVNMFGGNNTSSGNGGTVIIQGGGTDTGAGGNVNIDAGQAASAFNPGNINIGTIAGGGIINIGESTSGMGINLNNANIGLGVGAYGTTIGVGTGAGVKLVTIGSTNTSSALTLNAGSGNINIGATIIQGVSNQALTLKTQGTGALTVQSATGTISLGTSSILTANAGLTVSSAAASNLTLTAGSTGTASIDSGGAGTVNVGTANATTVGVGRAGSTTTINGNQSTAITATNGANSTTLNFANPTSGGALNVTVPANVGGTLCTTVASTCNTTYAPYSGTGYLFKGAIDTSSAAAGAGYLYGFTNSSSALAGGVLSLSNGTNTGNALSVTASGNPGSGSALLFASNTNVSPTGNLIDLQSGSSPTSKYSVSAAGNETVAGSITLGGDELFQAGATRTISVGTSATANAIGNNLIVKAGTANGSTTGNAGGSLNLLGGDGAGSGSFAGGAINITGGGTSLGATGSPSGGAITIRGGAANDTTNGTGGRVNIFGGISGNQGGNGGAVYIQGGQDASNNGAVGGNVYIDAGIGSSVGTVNIGTQGIGGGTSTFSTVNIGNGGTSNTVNIVPQVIAGGTGTINIGTSTTATSSTTVTIGSTIAGNVSLQSASTINLNAPTLATNQTTIALLNSTATTVNAFGAATTLAVGGAGGTVTFGNTGSSTLQGVSGQALTLKTQGAGALTVQSGSGTVSLGTSTILTANAGLTVSSAAANNIAITSGTTGSATLDSGTTGAVNVGTGANAKTVNIGNATGASKVVINGGTNGITIGDNGVANTLNLGNTSTTAAQTINIGNNASTGTSTVVIGSNQSSTDSTTLNGGLGTLAVTDTSVTVSNVTNSTTALQVTTATSNAVFSVDTTGSTKTVLGKASTLAGKLLFQNASNANTVTILSSITASGTLTLPGETGTVCTNAAGGTCSTTYAPYSATGYLAKGAVDTSSASVAAASYLYGFTNSNGTPATGGVLSLSNGANTGNTLYVTASGNPVTGLIVANAAIGVTGNLLNLQLNSSSVFTVNQAGSVTASSTIQGTSVDGTTGLNTGAAGGTQRVDSTGNLVNIGNITTTGASTLSTGANTLTVTSSNFNVTSAGAVTAISTIQGTSVDGTTGLNTGAAGGTQRVDSTGNLVNIGNITTTGASTISTGANALTLTSSNFNVTSAGAVTAASTIQGTSVDGTTGINTGAAGGTQRIDSTGNLVNIGNITTLGASTLSTGANALTVTSSSFNVTSTGALTLGASVGTGALTNNGATVNTVYNMANLATGGWDAGGAAATVDKYTYIAAGQTTASQTLTIPTPTANTTYGRVIYLSNTGSTPFTVLGTVLSNGSTATLIWANVNGVPQWTFAGADGSGILNQNSADQTANFRISGIGRANTSFTTPLLDVISAGTLSVGTGTATSITIGGAATTGTIAIGNSAANTINIGSSANAHTIAIGTDATTVQAVTIGSSSGASATTIYGGSGNIGLNAASITSNQASVNLLNSTTTTVNAFGASTAVNIGANNTVVTFGNSGAATLRSVTGALTITSAAAATWSSTGNLTVDSSGILNLGPSATGITIGASGITTTHNGTNQIGASAGTGSLVNNGATIATVYNMANLATGGWDAGGAAATVDKYTYIAAGQTTTLQTLTIPTPTSNTTYGRLLYLSNTGTTPFTVLGTVLSNGSTATLMWALVNGVGTWTFAGADGSGILNQNSADQTANFRISGTGRANTSFTAPLFDTITAATLSLGTGTANAISIGAAGITTTNFGTLKVGNTTGTGGLLNNGSTVNTVYNMANLATGGWDAGGAAATVDKYTYIAAGQTTGSQTLTIPTPTANTTYGRMLYLSNTGTTPFTVLGTVLSNGSTATLIWALVNGVGTWTFAGADGSGILNQNSADQTANFRISGTGRANTSFTAPLFDVISAGTLSVGTATATTIQLGSNGASNPIINIDSGTSGINIGTGAQGRTIAIGSGGAVQGITIGSTFAGSATLIQGPTVTVGTAGASIFKNNGATYNATCDYTAVTGATTLNTAAKTPDVCTVFRITTTGAATVTVPAPAAGAGSVVYVANMAASSNAITLLSASLSVGSTATLVYNGTAWTYAGADSSGLQTSYNNSAGAAPSIAMNTTNKAVTLQASATTGIAAGNELFGVRSAAANDTTLGNSILTVSTYGLGINVGTAVQNPVTNAAYDLQFGGTANRTIAIIDQATAATAGSNLTVKAAAGNTSGVGGNLVLAAGAGGNTAAGGNASLTGGAAGGGNTNGGTSTLQGGQSAGTGTGGAANVNGGLASATAGSNGGSVAITGANGAAGAGATAGGTAGAVTLQGGTGGAGTGTNSLGAAGANINILAGSAGISTGTAANANGGNIYLTAGAAGSGGSGTAGIPGVVYIDTPAFTASATQTISANTTITQSLIDNNSTVPINATGTAGWVVSVPTPLNTTVGRIVYITGVNGSLDFTLRPSGTGSQDISMKANSTATLVYNGTNWTAAGADASTSLQQVYNNTASSPASIITTTTAKNILFQAGSGFDVNDVFQVTNSVGANLIAVDTTNTATGAQLAQNGGGEVGGAPPTGWSAFVGTATPVVTQTTTAGEFASGTGGVKVTIGTAGTGGVNNALNATALSTTATTYIVSFSIKAQTSAPTNANIIVEYYRNNTPTLDATCSTFTQTTNPVISTTGFIKYNCSFTSSAVAKATTNFIRIRQADSVIRNLLIDNFSLIAQTTTGAQNFGDIKVGGATSQGLTLFTVDSFAAAPGGTGATINSDFLGSLYYDTTIGKLQCYEAKGWGSCGNSPNNSAFLIPEYPNAVLGAASGTPAGIGTMTASLCSGSGRLNLDTTLCATTTDDFNYYKWTSPQATAQTYSIYVRYQLPATYNGFFDANTVKLYGRTTNTTDGSVVYALYSATGSTACGTSAALGTTTVTTANNTWQQVNLAANETSATADCTFAANDIVTFRIDLSAKNNASVYASNLTFTTKGL